MIRQTRDWGILSFSNKAEVVGIGRFSSVSNGVIWVGGRRKAEYHFLPVTVLFPPRGMHPDLSDSDQFHSL